MIIFLSVTMQLSLVKINYTLKTKNLAKENRTLINKTII